MNASQIDPRRVEPIEVATNVSHEGELYIYSNRKWYRRLKANERISPLTEVLFEGVWSLVGDHLVSREVAADDWEFRVPCEDPMSFTGVG